MNLSHAEYSSIDTNAVTLPLSAPAVRVDGQGGVGPLLVYRENTWGSICDRNFDDTDAIVACRQLGYEVRPAPAPMRSRVAI